MCQEDFCLKFVIPIPSDPYSEIRSLACKFTWLLISFWEGWEKGKSQCIRIRIPSTCRFVHTPRDSKSPKGSYSGSSKIPPRQKCLKIKSKGNENSSSKLFPFWRKRGTNLGIFSALTQYWTQKCWGFTLKIEFWDLCVEHVFKEGILLLGPFLMPTRALYLSRQVPLSSIPLDLLMIETCLKKIYWVPIGKLFKYFSNYFSFLRDFAPPNFLFLYNISKRRN